jgi:serine/threonine protein phosphatase PrpC
MKVKGYIICDPEIRHHEIHPGDEYVILASDGIWDMFSNQQVPCPPWNNINQFRV